MSRTIKSSSVKLSLIAALLALSTAAHAGMVNVQIPHITIPVPTHIVVPPPTLHVVPLSGGVARAGTVVTNNGNINTHGFNSPGINANSNAYAGGGFYSGGSATATTKVTNNGNITTHGFNSPGINANSNASAGGGRFFRRVSDSHDHRYK